MKLRKLLSMALALCLCASLMVPMSSAALEPTNVDFGGVTAVLQGNGTYSVYNLQAWTSTDSFVAKAASLDKDSAAQLRFRCEMTFRGISLEWGDVSLSSYGMTDAKNVFVKADDTDALSLNENDNTISKVYKLDFENNTTLSNWNTLNANQRAEALTTTITFNTDAMNFRINNAAANPTVTATVTAYFDGSSTSNPVIVAQGSSQLVVWRDNTTSISGTVYSHGNNSVTVSICSGETIISGPLTVTGMTADDGKPAGDPKKYYAGFSFANVPEGLYNIVAEQVVGGKTLIVTKMIELPDDLTSGGNYDIVMPSGDTSSILELDPPTLMIIIGGLDELAQDNEQSGKHVETTLHGQKVTTSPDDETQNAINSINSVTPAGSQTDFYNFDINKTVDNSAPTAIHDTGANVITVSIPYSMAGKPLSQIRMFRYHSGAVQELTRLAAKPATPADGTFFADQAHDRINLYTTKFSTYAITYTPFYDHSDDSDDSDDYVAPVIPAKNPTSTSYKDCKQSDTCVMNNFSDISPKAWYHDGVHWALENKIMVGMDDGLFHPATSTTRAMVAVMLWRLEGSPKADTKIAYSDVGAKQWFADGVRWATEAGVINGYTDGSFGPNDPVTREQLATMLYRYAQYKNVNVATGSSASFDNYADAASVSSYALPAMKWASEVGIVNGLDDENSVRVLAPKDASQRSVVATMFMRYYTQVIK